MTDTTPDYAGLIERLRKEAARHASYDDISREGALLAEAASALRTLLSRFEAAEAMLAEAMKVIEPFAKAGELFSNVSPGEIEYDQCVYLPAAGDEYALMGSHLRAARALKENGNGE